DAPAADPVSQTQQTIRLLTEELVRLAVTDMGPPEFTSAFLQRVLQALAAPFGTLWLRKSDGHFEQQGQHNPGKIDRALTQDAATRAGLLREAVGHARPVYFPPGEAEAEAVPSGQPRSGLAEWGILFTPVLLNAQVEGFIEVWHSRQREAQAVP